MILDKASIADGPLSAAQQRVADRFSTINLTSPAPTSSPASTIDLSPVRVATEPDRGAVEALARLMHAEVGLFTIADDKLRAAIDLGIKHRLIGLVGEGEPRGVICLAITSMWFTHEFQLVDMFFFVHPDHRKTDYARSLIEWAKRVSDAIGVAATIGVFNTTRTEAKARMMGRHLEYSGSTFMHNRALALAGASNAEGDC